MIHAKVCCASLDERGNITVKTEYIFPDGFKKVGYARYSFRNFSRAKILADIKSHCETLILRANELFRNDVLLRTKVDDLIFSTDKAQLLIRQEKRDITGAILAPAVYETVTDRCLTS